MPVRLVLRDGRDVPPDAGAGRLERSSARADLFAEPVAWWADACAGIDTVIHLAWYAEPGQYLQSPLNLDCLAGTLSLAKGAAAAGVRRCVGVGTCFEYDLHGRPPVVDTPLRPTTPYAGAKAAALPVAVTLAARAGFEFAWCRLFYLYGGAHEDARRLVPYIRAGWPPGNRPN